MNDTQKPIPNSNNYFATIDGKIFRLRNGHMIEVKGYINKWGYLEVIIPKFGKRIKCHKHREICRAFHGNPESESLLARHLDDNRLNNNPSNLAWGTAMDNQIDARKNWVMRSDLGHWNSKLSENDTLDIKILLFLGARPTDIGPAFGITRQAVSRIKHGWVWSHI